MTKTYFSAQSGIISPKLAEEWHVVLIGCGGLGSYIGPVVSKLGIGRLDLVDFDRVEIDNIGGQNFTVRDLGMTKVEAVKNKCIGEVVANNIKVHDSNTLVDLVWQSPLKKIFISAVDNMATRSYIHYMVHHEHFNRLNARYIVDPRMGGEIGKVFCCNLLDIESRKRYASTLHSDGDGMALPCAERATGYNAMIISGIVSYMVKECVTLQGFEANNPECWYNNMRNDAFSLERIRPISYKSR